MTLSDKIKYKALESIAQRAAWLLARKDTARAALDITDMDESKLVLVWRVFYAELMLPLKFTGTEEKALRDAELWLKEKAGLVNG